MGYWNQTARARDGDALTPRELEILALLAAGNAAPDIAERLEITPSTVKTHLTSVYCKLGVTNRVQAARHRPRSRRGDGCRIALRRSPGDPRRSACSVPLTISDLRADAHEPSTEEAEPSATPHATGRPVDRS